MTKALKKLNEVTDKVTLSTGIVTIRQIRPFAPDGHHAMTLIDRLIDLFGVGEDGQVSVSAKMITGALADLTRAGDGRLAFVGTITHLTGLDESAVAELTLSDATLIVIKAAEVNADFFMQAAPGAMLSAAARMTDSLKRIGSSSTKR